MKIDIFGDLDFSGMREFLNKYDYGDVQYYFYAGWPPKGSPMGYINLPADIAVLFLLKFGEHCKAHEPL